MKKKALRVKEKEESELQNFRAMQANATALPAAEPVVSPRGPAKEEATDITEAIPAPAAPKFVVKKRRAAGDSGSTKGKSKLSKRLPREESTCIIKLRKLL